MLEEMFRPHLSFAPLSSRTRRKHRDILCLANWPSQSAAKSGPQAPATALTAHSSSVASPSSSSAESSLDSEWIASGCSGTSRGSSEGGTGDESMPLRVTSG